MPSSSDPPGSRPPSAVTISKLAVSSLWIVAARWILRTIGLLSTIVLVRLLTPRDFGLVALGTLVMGLLELMSETGQKLALIRLQRVDRGHYDTAWTLGVILGVFIALAMVVAAPLAAAYFAEARLEAMIQVLAIRPLLIGLENIGTIDFRRDLRFDMELKLLLWPRLLTFGVTIACALIWRDYWALVCGIIVGQAFTVAFSYVLHPYRPRLAMSRLRDLWSFSFWSLVAAIGRYCGEKADEVVIGRRFDAVQLGLYAVVGSTASMPVEELTTPAARALYPGFARLRDDAAALRQTYLDSLSVLYAVAILSSVGIAAVAHDIVLILLGDNWLTGVPLVAPLAFATATIGVGVTNNALATALGRPGWVAGRTWALALALIGSMSVLPKEWGLEGIAAARFVAAVVVTAVMQLTVARLVSIEIGTLWGTIWRPLIASGAMYGVLAWFVVPSLSPGGLRLSVCVFAGAVVAVGVQLLAWLACRRPRGVETLAVAFCAHAIRRLS